MRMRGIVINGLEKSYTKIFCSLLRLWLWIILELQGEGCWPDDATTEGVWKMMYQTQKTVFNHISKDRQQSFKYDAQRRILLNFKLFGYKVQHCLDCLTYLVDRS